MPSSLRLTPLKPMLIVGFASFCLMVIELIAGRIMAPTLGVSLYSWTSIIAVILGGITLGNALGGRIADRVGSHQTLGNIFIVAGLSTMLIVYAQQWMDWFYRGPVGSLLLATLYYSLMVFFAPAFFLSFVTPMVIKLHLNDLTTTGRTVGHIYAASAAGSIAGTMLTGYVLIDWFGTKTITIGIASLLILVGLSIGRAWKLLKHRIVPFYIMLFLVGLALPNSCTKESKYYCIIISSRAIEGVGDATTVRLDHLVHSFLVPDATTGVKAWGYSYERAFAQLVGSQRSVQDTFATFSIGGGGYVAPRYFHAVYPNSRHTVAEIDPGVTAINEQQLGLPRSQRLSTINQDARMVLKTIGPQQRYDYIFGDAFNDFAVPYHLTTRQFNQLLKQHLTPDGWYAINIIDDPRSGKFIASVVKTLQQDFASVWLVPDVKTLPPTGRTTFIVLASDAPLDKKAWSSATLPVTVNNTVLNTDSGESDMIKTITEGQILDQWLEQKGGIVLTDAYVPVDRMIAPLFSTMR